MLVAESIDLGWMAAELARVKAALRSSPNRVRLTREAIEVDCDATPWKVAELCDSIDPRIEVRWGRKTDKTEGVVSITSLIRGCRRSWATADDVVVRDMPRDILWYDDTAAVSMILDLMDVHSQIADGNASDVAFFRLPADADESRWTGQSSIGCTQDGVRLDMTLSWRSLGSGLVMCVMDGVVADAACAS